MKTIKFFHPEETFIYHIDKCLCKVVYQGKKKCLLVEIHSNDDLDHVEADSLQNDYPQLAMFIDDFPVEVDTVEQLAGKVVSIPYGFVEEEDEDGDLQEIYYTSLNVAEGDYEMVGNDLTFSQNEQGVLTLKWKGNVQDFTENVDTDVPFEVECTFDGFAYKEEDFD